MRPSLFHLSPDVPFSTGEQKEKEDDKLCSQREPVDKRIVPSPDPPKAPETHCRSRNELPGKDRSQKQRERVMLDTDHVDAR